MRGIDDAWLLPVGLIHVPDSEILTRGHGGHPPSRVDMCETGSSPNLTNMVKLGRAALVERRRERAGSSGELAPRGRAKERPGFIRANNE